jgi:hypothetical protein
MKVIVCKDEDAVALIDRMKLKEHELVNMFGQQDQQQRYVAVETVRGLMFVLIDWLKTQGFKIT